MKTMALMEHRVGENGLLPFRTRRVFNIGSDWFFAIRDGKDCGPFKDMLEAEAGLTLFLMDVVNENPH